MKAPQREGTLRYLLPVVMLVMACSAMPVAEPATTPTVQPTGAPSTRAPSTPSPAPTSQPSGTASPTPPASLPPDAIASIEEVRSPVGRLPRDAATDEQLAALVASDTDFAIRLYRKVIEAEQGNVFISPYSISTALSMAYAGARGETARQMAEVLGVSLDDAAWHAARGRLDLELAALARRPRPSGAQKLVPFTLEPVNTMFGQAGWPFEAEFLDTLAASYGAGLQAVNFGGNPEAARLAINEWVADKTRDRIPDVLQPGDVTPETVFALVNAIYFKANWLNQFDPDVTEVAPFHRLDGSSRDVQMMNSYLETAYARGDGWQAVSLPYDGASMVIVLPDAGRFDEIEAAIDADFMTGLPDRFEEYGVTLSLPRWESESRANLADALIDMGMSDAFDCVVADLSGIASGGPNLCLFKVIHQANVTVDEEGTEAAAATVVLGGFVCACGPSKSVTLSVDRPFLYFIQDQVAGEILFMGRLLEP